MKKLILCLTVVLAIALPLLLVEGPPKQVSASPETERVHSVIHPARQQSGFFVFQLAEFIHTQEVNAYLASMAEAQRAEDQRLAGEEWVRETVEAQVRVELEALTWRKAPPQYAAAPTGSTVGDCSGFAIPDYIIQRESGGNPNAMNPSGAYGCAQTLLSHYYGGSCSGLDPYTIEGQRQCVNILSNGGTNLSPWAETR